MHSRVSQIPSCRDQQLYRLLKDVNKSRAALMVVLALLCVPISFLAEVNNLAVLRLLGTKNTTTIWLIKWLTIPALNSRSAAMMLRAVAALSPRTKTTDGT